MRKILSGSLFTLFLSLVFATAISAQNTYLDWKVKGDKAYDRAAYREAVGFYQKAFALQPANPGDAYNTACCYALIKDEKNAFKYLDLAIQNGWTNEKWMLKDTDLSYLHQFPQWSLIVEKTKSKRVDKESGFNITLREELLQMEEADQAARKKAMATIDEFGRDSEEAKAKLALIQEIDKKNTARLKAIVAEYGWPVRSLVGRNGAHAAWLLVQHADLDPVFQEHCLELMKPFLENDEISRSNYAYLYDRVKTGKGDFQLYGTQALTDPETGEPRFFLIKNESELDKRRASMNISSTASEYAIRLGFEYVLPDAEQAVAYQKQMEKKYSENIKLAEKAINSGNAEKSCQHFNIAFKINGYIKTSDLVRGSAVFAQLGGDKTNQAFWYLRQAISRGFKDLKSIEENPAFENMIKDERWEDLKSLF